MSPILKRDIHEQLRHAKRLALAAAGRASDEGGGGGGDDDEGGSGRRWNEYEWEEGHGDVQMSSYPGSGPGSGWGGGRGPGPGPGPGPGVGYGHGHHQSAPSTSTSYASGSNPRQGIGVDDVAGDAAGGEWREVMRHEAGEAGWGRTSEEGEYVIGAAGVDDRRHEREQYERDAGRWGKRDDRAQAYPPLPPLSFISLGAGRDGDAVDGATIPLVSPGREGLHRSLSHHSHSHHADEYRGPASKLVDLRNLLFESTPSLLLLIIGEVFTGQLLEHLARWRVFLRVDELFILVPMLGNLKGNLEMCLSARLGTSAAIGELDHRRSRAHLVGANMTLLGLQALLISCLAAAVSFVLGLVALHRLGDVDAVTGSPITGVTGVGVGVGVGMGLSSEPGLGAGDDSEWHEGYTRPGWKQLVMVLATGMGSAGISSAVLGSFMGSVIVLCRWKGIDPDNITPPLAACLGDLLTLFILALLGAALVGMMDTPLPLLLVLAMAAAAVWFTRRVMRDPWVRNVAKGGWTPLIAAMLISSGTGMALERGVGEYRGFALLAIPMTGLTGSIGAIHANRLSTALHTGLHPASLHPRTRPTRGMSPLENALALYAVAYVCQLAFVGFVTWFGWIDLDLGLAGWVCFGLTTAFSLVLAQWMTLFFWSKDLDPDSYTLPMHSALVDFVGQCLLMLTYELCIARGMDVRVRQETRVSM